MKRTLALLIAVLLMFSLASTAFAAAREIVLPIAGDPEQMDPTLNSYARSSQVLQQLFRGLYKLGPDAKEFLPAMADGYTLSDDQLTYTFTLKDGLKWSDGSALTAHDFEYSWKRVLDPDVASRANSDMWVLKNGKAYAKGEATADDVGVKALDDGTLEVTVEYPTPWFISLTAITSFLPVKKDVVEQAEVWTKSSDTYVCNGPFMPATFSSNEFVKMIPNPNYYEADKVNVPGITFVIIPDAATVLTAYNNGDINVTDNLNPDAMDQYSSTPEFYSLPRIGLQYSDFNCRLPEFQDKRVRQAFAIAIDRQAILNALRYVEKPLYGLVPYAFPSISDPTKSYREVAGDMFKEDIPAAQALLAEAGYPNGEGFPEVNIVVQSSYPQPLYAQILGEMWKQNLGITYQITTYESATYWNELEEGNFSSDRNGYTMDYLDPDDVIKKLTTGSNFSENAWCNPEYDAIYAATKGIADPVERENAIIAAERYLIDQMPVFPVYSFENFYVVKPGIVGVIKNPIGHFNFEYVTYD